MVSVNILLHENACIEVTSQPISEMDMYPCTIFTGRVYDHSTPLHELVVRTFPPLLQSMRQDIYICQWYGKVLAARVEDEFLEKDKCANITSAAISVVNSQSQLMSGDVYNESQGLCQNLITAFIHCF